MAPWNYSHFTTFIKLRKNENPKEYNKIKQYPKLGIIFQIHQLSKDCNWWMWIKLFWTNWIYKNIWSWAKLSCNWWIWNIWILQHVLIHIKKIVKMNFATYFLMDLQGILKVLFQNSECWRCFSRKCYINSSWC